MRILFFYFLIVYILHCFSELFLERPEKPLRAAFLLFFGPLWDIYVNIRLALARRP